MDLTANWINQGSGRLFADTLLGSLLSKSCIPASEVTAPEHFDRPGSTPASVHAATEQRIWAALEGVGQAAHDVFKKLLANKNEDVRHFTLLWIGECFREDTHSEDYVFASLISNTVGLKLSRTTFR